VLHPLLSFSVASWSATHVVSSDRNQVIPVDERQKFETDLYSSYQREHTHAAQGVLAFLWAAAKGLLPFVKALAHLPILEPRDAAMALVQADHGATKVGAQQPQQHNMAYAVYDSDAMLVLMPIGMRDIVPAKRYGAKRTTALFEASGGGHVAVVSFLLDLAKSNPVELRSLLDFRDDEGKVIAGRGRCVYMRVACMHMLYVHTCGVCVSSPAAGVCDCHALLQTALSVAAAEGCLTVVELLVAAGASLEVADALFGMVKITVDFVHQAPVLITCCALTPD